MKLLVLIAFFGIYGLAEAAHTSINELEVADAKSMVLENADWNGLPVFDGDLQYSATGTGNTTGHIADLQIRNMGEEDRLINIPPFYIPPTEGYQSYIAPYSRRVNIPAKRVVVIPIKGYCADVNTPPVPDGKAVTDPASWVRPNMEVFDEEGLVPDLVDGLITSDQSRVKPDEVFIGHATDMIEDGTRARIPGNTLPRDLQDEAFESVEPGTPFTLGESGTGQNDVPVVLINPEKRPQLAADIYYDAITKIEESVDFLREEGLINTPFSGTPDREREALIQQTFWIFTSMITGTKYEYGDFREKLKEQFAELIGTDMEDAPEDMREQFESGAESFWDSFNLVGEEAKVFKEVEKKDGIGRSPDVFEEAEPTEEPEPPVFEPAPPPCDCGDIVVTPMKIVDATTGEEITSDSLSTLTYDLEFHPPEISTDCPDHCREFTYVRIGVDSDYTYMHGRRTIGMRSKQQIRVHGPGKKTFNARYGARCQETICIDDAGSRIIHFTEDNDCCHEIRANNNGLLAFHLDGLRVTIRGNTIHMTPDNGSSKSFEFPYHVEALFCNAQPDRIFSYSERISEQRTSEQDGVTETHSNKSISIDNNPAGVFGPYYSILFGAQQNGSEYTFSMSASPEDDCKIFVQVWKDGELLESINQYD
ncbi:MAG: hypothetical protein EA411_12640 [Saprospirales bacterium]|nr:MAG: hypothetical protein EA411_12640 [Saprospirales bacterium]